MNPSNLPRADQGKQPNASQPNGINGGNGQSNSSALSVPPLPQTSLGMSQNPNTIFQQIQEMSSKRISTLNYLRKVHDGPVYWYNTLLFTKADFTKLSYFETKKLARRASNFLVLGLSLPTILDINPSNPVEYLRALNSLLAEFESYQQVHPPEGGSSSSLSRARIPQMFKRSAHVSTKGRRTSSATDIGLPLSSVELGEQKSGINPTGPMLPAAASFPASDQDLLPGEEYNYLLTPSLPFDPDFFETFATLCDVLIECYTRVISLIPTPAAVVPGIGDTFAKADARLRKVMFASVVKEFEDASRAGAKGEFAGLGKVVLGGLM